MARGRVKSPSDAATNWRNAMSAPQTATKYSQGVNAVSVAPNASAASPQAIQRYQQATADAVNSGRLASANQAVSLDQWKSAAGKGASRLATGAANNADKQARAAQRLAPFWQQARDAAEAIPNDGSEASAIARFTASMRVMKASKGAK